MPDQPHMPLKTTRVLIASHSHPNVLHGGSEVASHALFQRLRGDPGWRPTYLGCARDGLYARAGSSITQPFADDDHLYSVGDFEGFKFANRDPAFPHDLRSLLRRLDPQIVHFHHYVNFGLETFFHVRATLPHAKLVLTLHEYLAICHQQGQMVKRFNGALCERADPVACSRCFPEVQPADFFLRRLYGERFLSLVDHFIAPSRFLADRYIAWGLPAASISVIENVPRPACRTEPAERPLPSAASGVQPASGAPRLRVGFFGQISELKGISVLLDAAALLDDEDRTDIVFSINGDTASQPAEFQAGFLERIAAAGRNVLFYGAYANDRVEALMQAVDLVVVPSVWWENSPVVIQEAFRCGRAVVCSDIGGMAEKVEPGRNGAHFRVGSARALADTLLMLADDPDQVRQMGETARAGADPDAAYAAHLRVYAELLGDTVAPPVVRARSHGSKTTRGMV